MLKKVLALAVVGLAATSPATTAAESDPKARALAERVLLVLGGGGEWNRTRYLRFDFAVDRGGKTVMRRAHTWDKWTGRYRVEGRTKDGKAIVVAMDLGTKQGAAAVDGQPLSGAPLKQALEDGYAWWVNDTYWLLMPYKMLDPGVRLEYVGQRAADGQAWHRLLLTFDNVGLTPKDRYWVFVNKKTELVDRWEFVLKGEQTAPVPFDWKGWKTYGKLKFADERVNPKDGTRIHFPVLELPASVDEVRLTRP